MKFLMVTTYFPPYHVGGDAQSVKYLSDELLRRGHEVMVLSNPSVYRLLKSREPKTVDERSSSWPIVREYEPSASRLELLADYSLGVSKRATRHLKSLAREYKPDVIHWHNTKGFISTPVCIDKSVLLYTAHDYYSVCPRTNLIRSRNTTCANPRFCQLCLMRWHKLPQPWRCGSRRVLSLPEHTRIIAPSQYMATRLMADGLNVPTVIRTFVPDRGIVSEAYRKDSLTYLGMLEPHKGLGTLLDAFARSALHHPLNLDIVGEGSMKGDLQAKTIRCGLSDRVRIHGFVPYNRLEDILNRSAAIIVPSEWPENSPSVIMEALSRGIPVIGSRAGGIPEIINEDIGCLLFEPGNVSGLSETIISIWNDADMADQRRRKARTAYESQFTPDAYVDAYLNLIYGC